MEHVDLNGLRPLDRAIECGNIAAIQVFLKKGAKLGPTTWSLSATKPDIMYVNETYCGYIIKYLSPIKYFCVYTISNTFILFCRLILLNKLLEDGNTLYRKNRFDEAAHRYGYAVRRISVNISNNNNSINDPSQKKENINHIYDDEMGNSDNLISFTQKSDTTISMTFSQLKVHLLLNLSRCQRRLGRHAFKYIDT